ncbi:MAG: helix-turn-helix transcriptional regulator [Dinoroseobacter sp.]|nr:helix-turn-helix transcriptional regulator [Dinoroseobacter sp.]
MDDVLTVIDQRLRELGLSDAAASKMAVGNASLIKNMRLNRGKKRYNYDAINSLAEVLGLELYFGPVRDSAWGAFEVAHDNFVSVPFHQTEASAGPGIVSQDGDPIGDLAFERRWLDRLGLLPGKTGIVRVRGDSMEPTIRCGSIALIDETSTDPNGKPYAFVEDGELRIKRLTKDNQVLAISSDNPNYSPEIRLGLDMSSIRILGEVVWTAYNWRDDPKLRITT